MLCRHCHQKNATRPRGLCHRCYYDPAIQVLYPSTSKHAPRPEPTEADLNAMIAEQRACLPAWWDRETAKQHEE